MRIPLDFNPPHIRKRLAMMLAVSLLLGQFVPLTLRETNGQERGVGVKIKVETGRVIDLYDESHALVIGVSDYNNGWRKLPGVVEDIAQVSAVLKRQGFKVVSLLNPTRAELDAAIQLFISQRGLKERNRLVIYFAGHGHTERLSDDRDLGYIVMRNAPKPEMDPQQFSLCVISMDEINAYALRIKSKHALFVFDSCFAGSIFRSEGANRPPPQIESKTAGPVRQFITSGTAGQEVPDDSIFRRYFVRAFDERLGDLDGDGYITGEELGIYLKGRVASDSRDTQTPLYGKIKDAKLNIGDVVFELKSSPPAPPRPADPCAKEEDAWNQARNSRSAAVVRAFLREYPNCLYAANARILLISLETPAPVEPSPPLARYARVSGNRPLPLVTMGFTTAKVDANGSVTRLPPQTANGYIELLPGRTRLEMVEVGGGPFMMGSPDNEKGRHENEGPQHKVTVRDFYCGRYEVTQGQWKAVMGVLSPKTNDLSDKYKDDYFPVMGVSWDEAKEFIEKLNKLTGGDYRLPSEAEWEYAARAGSQEAFSFGPAIPSKVVNCRDCFPSMVFSFVVEVGRFSANAFGLFDMHWNVYEWCEDDWHDSYTGAPADGRAWVDTPSRGSGRVARGGSFLLFYSRSADRSNIDSSGSLIGNIGFRLVRTATSK